MDTKNYRVLKLGNGLEVLLASDPEADSSGASLTVRCGTFQDQDEHPGLAHFHEHMLFLGTEKYPEEDEYSRFLNEHGGDSNAFTMSEYTTYHFKVASPHLEGALDRFSQFFLKPEFTPSCVEREMNAVDSENSNYSTEDGWRMLQVVKATAADEHPFARFDVGNLDTLGSDDPAGMRLNLIDWNKQTYQAGAMRLAVLGRESLDDLQKMVEEYFGSVRNGGGVPQDYATEPWPQDKLQRILSVVPLKDMRSVSVCWPLPPTHRHLFSKPELYMSHVLGHEGEGSLHDVLNQKGWVESLSAGPTQSFSDQQLFSVSVALTPEGDRHREEILALIFEYVKLLRREGPKDETYHELKSLQEISFTYKEDSPAPDDFAAAASHSLHHYPASEALRGPFIIDEWKPDLIRDYLEEMVPEKCLVFIVSPEFREEAAEAVAKGVDSPSGWKPEEWYGTLFKDEPLAEETMAKWRKEAHDDEDGDPLSGLRLPTPNPFIPDSFDLRGKSSDFGADALEKSRSPLQVLPPTKLESPDEGLKMQLWHKTDAAFGTPRAYLLIQAHSKAYQLGPEVIMMLRMFCSVVDDDLNALAYDASMAGLGFGLGFNDSFSMSVSGFNDKMPRLLSTLVERIEQVLEEAEAAGDVTAANYAESGISGRALELLEKLETQRQVMLQDYQNFTREEPWSVCGYYATHLLTKDTWHLSQYIEVLQNPISLKQMATMVRKGLKELELCVLAHGNLTAEEAQGMAKTLSKNFKIISGSCEPLDKIPRPDVVQLPAASTCVFEYDLAADNPAQENSCTKVIYQVGELSIDTRRDAALSLICHVAGNSAYQRLRTEEQLGYIVTAAPWICQHVGGLTVIVQGNRLPPHEADERIEAWLTSFEQELADMSEEEFNRNVAAIISERSQRYVRMGQETSRHWGEIQPKRFRFGRIAESVKALEKLTKDDVLELFRERLSAGAPERRKVSVRILGTSAGERLESVPEDKGSSKTLTVKSLEELRTFRSEAEAFPQLPEEDEP